MRPIWIKIKGLNSFLEPQEIDFQELTGEGLFGIFGPTGSGKSSILDGITLALYGTTARNSGNFIHVSTDKALVDYIFSVKTKETHTYRVTRGFKRSKEGSIRSDGTRFLEIRGEQEEVLADKVGSVNEKCQEVIGLSKEDFFRTVVLPQGKFSEFLKLDGMERNKMLERLFHLEKYGEELVQIIRARVQQWQGKEKEQQGALSRYEEITLEKTEELKEKEKACEEQFKKEALELQETRRQLEEEKVRLEAQKEYDSLKKEARQLEEQQGEMILAEDRIRQAQKAERLWKDLQDFLQGQQTLTERKEKLEQLLGEQKKLEQEKAVLKEKVEKAREKKRESASGPGDTEDPPGRGNRSSGRDENPGGRGPEKEKRSGGPEPSASGGSDQTGKAGERSETVRREKRRGGSCPEQGEDNCQGTGGCSGRIPALAGAGQKKRRKREKRKGAGTAPWPTGNRK